MRIKFALLAGIFLLFIGFSVQRAEAGVSMPMIIEPIETGIAGSASNIMVKNATPNFPVSAGGVEYYYSLNPGVTPSISAHCPGTSLQLNNAVFFGRMPTNSDGIASRVVHVPGGFANLTAYIQVIDTGDCDASSVVSLTFEPPITEFDLFLNPLIPGQVGRFNVFSTNFATPGGFVKYIWGLNAGPANAGSLCPGFIADISDFNDLGNLPVDDFGNTIGGYFVPHGAAGLTILIQAVDLLDCSRKSNVLSTTF